MTFADLALAKRLERAEGYACLKFAEARQRISPAAGSEWLECAGAYVVFDGVESPVTQTFCLGLFETITPAALDAIEAFFRRRGAPIHHEVSPLAGVAALDLLCARGYRPIEIASVLHQPVQPPPAPQAGNGIVVRLINPDEGALWAQTGSQGWIGDHPELEAFFVDFGRIAAAREGMACFLAEIDGQPAATGALSMHEGVALFAGASTVPQFRRRGLQAALLHARMSYASERGCDLAMMVAEAGSGSQRNAERQGFRIAYTRTKWKLT